MKRIIEIFKPRFFNTFLMLLLVFWQYLSFYEEMGQQLLYKVAQYLLSGLNFIHWEDTFVRSGSLLFLWVIIAVIIYAAFLSVETVSVYFHNLNLKKRLSNVGENLELLKKRKVRTLESHFAFLAGIIFTIILLTIFVPYLETLRSQNLDLYLYGLQEKGYYPDFNNLGWKLISFGFCLPILYFLASINIGLYSFSKKEKKREEIIEEHYAVAVDDSVVADAGEEKNLN